MICEGIAHVPTSHCLMYSPKMIQTYNDAFNWMVLLIRMHHNHRGELRFVLLAEIPQKCGSPFIYSLFVDSGLGVVVVELVELAGLGFYASKSAFVSWSFARSDAAP